MKTNAIKSHKRVKLRQKFASKDAGKLKVRLDTNMYLNGKTVHHAFTRNVSKCNSTFYRELDKSLSVTKEKKEKYVGEKKCIKSLSTAYGYFQNFLGEIFLQEGDSNLLYN